MIILVIYVNIFSVMLIFDSSIAQWPAAALPRPLLTAIDTHKDSIKRMQKNKLATFFCNHFPHNSTTTPTTPHNTNQDTPHVTHAPTKTHHTPTHYGGSVPKVHVFHLTHD